MRPQSFDCGWLTARNVLQYRSAGFNEAAVFRLRMGVDPSRNPEPWRASMRPQSFDCGWLSVLVALRIPLAICFNEAAVFRLRMVQLTIWLSFPLTGFNEAAVFRLRMASAVAPSCPPGWAASMRPQSFDCGWGMRLGKRCRVCHGLQ